ncbi:uncharacterized protein LOC108193940 [Daucus carota subsp. sativus]|uniref:uncharacterized protein LOC108193940 n=1 Tax=Daucus carota subsp. sativus TaxID=79200 RepID=UPI0007F01CEF|nr:PREDICTED: maf-like protein DDB_G0281937 [Daucus carota subsp. sativus]
MATKKLCESFSKTLIDEAHKWGCMKQTGVSLRHMMKFGSRPTDRNLLSGAQFLHKKLPIRIARRAIELETLPYGLSQKPAVFKIILGSSSMARRKILGDMGYEFTIMTADIDEKAIRMDKPEDLVVTLAEAKADAIIARLKTMDQSVEDASSKEPTLLITADTVVVYEGTIREKPSDKKEARHFIKGYSGGQASVVGSVVVSNLTTGKRTRGWDRAEVYFHEIPDEVIDSMVEEEIMLKVAGGLTIEHPLTLPYIDTVVGTYDSVMGLSKSLTEKLIQEAL